MKIKNGKIIISDKYQDKKMHVSPFSPSCKGYYKFSFVKKEFNASNIIFKVQYYIDNKQIINTHMSLNNKNSTLPYYTPVGIYTIFLIYLEAFKLFIKNTKVYDKNNINLTM